MLDASSVAAVVSPDGDGAFIAVLAQPRASRTAVVGVHDGMLKVALAAPPVDGAANEALVRGLASLLGVPGRDVAVVKGASSRRKVIRVALAPEVVVARLLGDA